MHISDWLMILAVLFAPLVAVQVQKWLEQWKDKKQRKLRIFLTLMVTRVMRLSSDHVNALNLIGFTQTKSLHKQCHCFHMRGVRKHIHNADFCEFVSLIIYQFTGIAGKCCRIA